MTRYLINMQLCMYQYSETHLANSMSGLRGSGSPGLAMSPSCSLSDMWAVLEKKAQTKAKHSWTQRRQILVESLFKMSQVVLSRTVYYISGQLRSHWVETDWLTMDGKTINAWLSLHNDQLQDLMFLPLSCQATSSTPKGSIWPNACKRANMTGFKRGRDTDIRSPKTWAAWQIIIWAAAIVVIRSGFCIRK